MAFYTSGRVTIPFCNIDYLDDFGYDNGKAVMKSGKEVWIDKSEFYKFRNQYLQWLKEGGTERDE